MQRNLLTKTSLSEGPRANLLYPRPHERFTAALSRLLGQPWSYTQTEPVLDLALSRGLVFVLITPS